MESEKDGESVTAAGGTDSPDPEQDRVVKQARPGSLSDDCGAKVVGSQATKPRDTGNMGEGVGSGQAEENPFKKRPGLIRSPLTKRSDSLPNITRAMLLPWEDEDEVVEVFADNKAAQKTNKELRKNRQGQEDVKGARSDKRKRSQESSPQKDPKRRESGTQATGVTTGAEIMSGTKHTGTPRTQEGGEANMITAENMIRLRDKVMKLQQFVNRTPTAHKEVKATVKGMAELVDNCLYGYAQERKARLALEEEVRKLKAESGGRDHITDTEILNMQTYRGYVESHAQ